MLILLPIFLYGLLRGAGAYLIHGDPLETSDAIALLNGGNENRVAQAVRLMQDRQAKWLIVTEPGKLTPNAVSTAGEIMRDMAVEQGLSPYVIQFTEDKVASTHDEAEAILHTMQKHQYQSVIVVTDPYHTQRTRLIFQDAFRGSGLRVLVSPVQSHWYRSDTWFLSSRGWGHTVREYVKLIGFATGLSSMLQDTP